MNTALDISYPSLRTALEETERTLAAASSAEPRAVAEWLLAAVLDCSRMELHVRVEEKLTESQYARLLAYRERAARREPVQYVLGETEFMGLRLGCDRRALIPRPETELLAEMVTDDARVSGPARPVIVDVGTGTGCLALALAVALPQATVTALDIDEDALALARENAARLGLQDRLVFRRSDLLEALGGDTVDLIVANLPYVASDDWPQLPPEVRDYEPRGALDGGPRGLAVLERLIVRALPALRPGGRLYLEIGADQGAPVRALLEDAGFDAVTIHRDWKGRERIARGTRP